MTTTYTASTGMPDEVIDKMALLSFDHVNFNVFRKFPMYDQPLITGLFERPYIRT